LAPLDIPAEVGGKELKQLVTSAATWSSVGSAASVIGSVVEIGGGTAYNERVGRNVTLHDLRLTLTLLGGQSNLATDDGYNTFRVVVFQAETGFSTNFALATQFTPAILNGLIRVFFDKTYVLQPPGLDTVGYMPASKMLTAVIPLGIKHTYVSANSNGSAPYRIFLGMVSDSVAVSNPGIQSTSSIVTTYTDA